MAAVRLLRWQSEAELVAVPVPEPGLGRGAAQGEAAGLCHSDLYLMEWSAGTLGRGPSGPRPSASRWARRWTPTGGCAAARCRAVPWLRRVAG